MANSASNLDLISSSQASKEVTANALFDAASSAITYGRRASTTTALTWGYYGGNVTIAAGTMSQIANGTVALTASQTNYIVAAKSNGVVTASAAITNWNDETNYWRLYVVVAGASTVTSYTDSRQFALFTGLVSFGAMSYRGTWDASTNTPTLSSGTGTKGYYYVVSVSGTTNLDGIAAWSVNDTAIFNGTTWNIVQGSVTAAEVSNTPAGSIVATNVQAAIDELDTKKSSVNGTLDQFAATTSAQLAGVISDETGSGSLVFAKSPVLVTPTLGTPISGNLVNCTGLPIASGVAGLAAGAADFLGNPTVNRAATNWLSGLRVFGNDTIALWRGQSATYKITYSTRTITQYFLIATLPIPTTSTGDSLLLDFTIGGENTQTERIRLRLGNRNGFKADTEYYSRQETAIAPMARIEAYTQVDGSVLVYAVFNATIVAHMTLSAIMGGWQQIGTLVAPEALVSTTTVPLGTLSYSSATDYVNASLKNVAGVVAGQNGIGCIIGQGGTVTQATSKATGVTLSKTTGAITTAADSLAPSTVVFFVLTNTFIAANDILEISHKSGGTFAAYDIQARCAAGSATIAIRNLTAGALAEALTLQFILLKGAIV